ncbi:MAG: ABC transporter permease [Candidatus Hodarchaeota archaeon]
MRNPFRKAIAIVRKEMLSLARDKISLFFTILVPIAIIVAYGLTFVEDDPVESVDLEVGIVNEDGDHFYTNQLTECFLNSTLITATIEPNAAHAQDRVLKGTFIGAVIIPSGFNDSFGSLIEVQQLGSQNITTVELLLIFDDSKHTVGLLLRSKIANITTEFVEAFGGIPLSLRDVSLTEKNLTTRDAAVGTVLGIAIFFACFDDIASALARERERGTLLRLFLTEISRWQVFFGKLVSSLILTLLRITLLLFILTYWFGVDIEGDLWMIYLIGLLIAINTIGLGFIISSRNVSERAVVIINFAAMVPLLFLTGVLQPLDMMPEATRAITWWIPYSQSNDALRRVIHLGQGLSYPIIQQELLFLILAAFLEYLVAGLLWKRRID